MDVFKLFQIADADVIAFVTYVCVHASHIYIYTWHTPNFDTKSKKQKRHKILDNYRATAPNQGPWGGGGTIYIYIYAHPPP